MSTATLSLLAPAKLNLFLHITGRRADGYHELQTLFQLLDYGDTLQFQRAGPGILSLHVSGPMAAGLPMDHNLIMGAAHSLRREAGQPLGARITLDKRIPAGAGLGGGSSDAAATLLALNSLWELNLSRARLEELALELGADVPVFVRGQSAWAEGIGERLSPVTLAPSWYLVIAPDCLVSTAAVFSHENLTRNSRAITMADFLAGRAGNDCAAVTRALYPEVDSALNWLQQFGPADMTGTGAAVFTSFPDEASARELLAKLPPGLNGFVARGIDALQRNMGIPGTG